MVVSNILYFHPYFGEDFQFDSYFSDGLVQPPTSLGRFFLPFLEEHFLTPNPNQEEVEDWRVTDFQGDLTRKAGPDGAGGSDEPEFVASPEN